MDFLDRLASWAFRLASKRLAVFPDGMGSGDLGRLVDMIPHPTDPIQPLDLSFEEIESTETWIRKQGTFESPFRDELPPSAHRAHLEVIEPRGEHRRCQVLLQMWGDEGFSMRRKVARRLANRGIKTVLPIHPFYGRRRHHSEGPPIRTVEEFMRMGLGAVIEARSILQWFRQDQEVGLGGFSMGSGFSVGASTTLPFPVALTLMGSAPSPAKAFTEGVLQEGLPPNLKNGEKARLAKALDSVSALQRPILDHHQNAVILAARGDGFVPLEEAQALARHWKGSELRTLGGGHATLWFFQVEAMIQAIERSFERHETYLKRSELPAPRS